jgi:hypothetical protein
MSFDTRASRAADALRAAVEGVSPMAQLTQLRQASTRRDRFRTATAAALAGVVLVAGGWLVANHPWRSDAVAPAHPQPSPSVTGPGPLTTAQAVGSHLHVPLSATASAGWTLACDCDFVWMSVPDAGFLSISGPVTQVWNPLTHKAVPPPPDYVHWLRTHPWLTVLSDRPVEVDGQQVHVLTMRVRADATLDLPGLLAKVELDGQPWVPLGLGETFTEAILTVDGRTVLVSAWDAGTATEQNALDAALLVLLHSIRLG